MIEFAVNEIFPRFILEDKEGYAMAKAIEAGLKYFLERCQRGLDILLDPDKMPEWRLDERAWELNCMYDFSADVEVKRGWIKNAEKYYSVHGTPAAIYNYLTPYFDAVSVEEAWQYGADPYHFRVTVTGEWNEANDEWAKKAVATAQNVRSVLDGIIFNSGGAEIPLFVAAATCGIDITHEAKMLG